MPLAEHLYLAQDLTQRKIVWRSALSTKGRDPLYKMRVPIGSRYTWLR
jgi:hypothetical protein